MQNTNDPTVSVIIPTYNRAHTIMRAIQSILKQTYQDLEIIIVDDGSIDETRYLIYQIKDKRLRYINHGHNLGVAVARNIGIKLSRGKYIAFQDSDDESLPYRLEKQVEILDKKPEIDIAYSDMIRISKYNIKNLIRTPDLKPKQKDIINTFLSLKGENIGIGSCIVRKTCFEKIGLFDENLRRLEELDFFIRASKLCHFYKINSPLIKYYETTRDEKESIKLAVASREYLLKKYYKIILKNKKNMAAHYFTIGNELCYLGQTKEGSEYILKAIQLDPLRIKPFIAFLISLSGSDFYSRLVTYKNNVQRRTNELTTRLQLKHKRWKTLQ